MAPSSTAGEIRRLSAIVLNLTLTLVAAWLWARLLQGQLVQSVSLAHALLLSMILAATAIAVRALWFGELLGVSAARVAGRARVSRPRTSADRRSPVLASEGDLPVVRWFRVARGSSAGVVRGSPDPAPGQGDLRSDTWHGRETVPELRVRDGLMRWGPTGALLAVAVALTLPGTSLQTLLVIWGLTAAEEFAVWRLLGLQAAASAISEEHGLPPLASVVESLPPQTTQRLTRTRTDQGQDQLVGLLRASFAARQRNETLHVAFCPPFANVPELQCRQTAGVPARIKATQVLPQGARLELKLDATPEESSDVEVEFTAVGTS